MSEENETSEEGISHTQKMIMAVAAVFVAGYFAVGSTKIENKSAEQLESEAMITSYASMMRIGIRKCPDEILSYTKAQVFNHNSVEGDKSTYLTLVYDGDDKNFKKAECTISLIYGGMSKLVIDGKVLVDRSE
jgi:hypothetical protein